MAAAHHAAQPRAYEKPHAVRQPYVAQHARTVGVRSALCTFCPSAPASAHSSEGDEVSRWQTWRVDGGGGLRTCDHRARCEHGVLHNGGEPAEVQHPHGRRACSEQVAQRRRAERQQ